MFPILRDFRMPYHSMVPFYISINSTQNFQFFCFLTNAPFLTIAIVVEGTSLWLGIYYFSHKEKVVLHPDFEWESPQFII